MPPQGTHATISIEKNSDFRETQRIKPIPAVSGFMSDQTPPERIAELEDRIEQLDATIRKMLPSRREALGLGVAGLAGASLMSGTASAGSSQVGTIGDSNNLVDVEAEDIDVSDTLTTQDIVVNGTATGPFGGGGVVLESGDSITVATIDKSSTNSAFVTLYNGSAKDVLGGVVSGGAQTDFLYTFADSSTLKKNTGSATQYDLGNGNQVEDQAGDLFEIDFLPPAKEVTKIEVGANLFSTFSAEVILKD